MTTNYIRGAIFENVVKKKFQKHGYFVMRSAGSRSEVDLIAIREKGYSEYISNPFVLFVQCKKDFNISSVEFYKLKKVSDEYYCIPVLCGKIKSTILNMHIKFMTYKDYRDVLKSRRKSLSRKRKSRKSIKGAK